MAKSTSLTGLSTATLEAEITRRRSGINRLHRKRERLLAAMAKIDAEIIAAGGSISGRPGAVGAGRKRAKNDRSLLDALLVALKDKTMSVTAVAEAVQRQGYVTTSPNFRTIVNQTLISHKGKFKKVARGQYTAA